MAFSVNKNLVYFCHIYFFLDTSHNISQNMRFWKEDTKKCKKVLFWTESTAVKESESEESFYQEVGTSLETAQFFF